MSQLNGRATGLIAAALLALIAAVIIGVQGTA